MNSPLINNISNLNLERDLDQGKNLEPRCCKCDEDFALNEKIFQTKDEQYHLDCFVCSQCFKRFPQDLFYEFDGRKYCEHDFQVLFSPTCHKCNNFIIGRVIKALNASWHPECFTCHLCNTTLIKKSFVKLLNKPVCHDCKNLEKNDGLINCFKCHEEVPPNQKLKYRSEYFHCYHFNCSLCKVELTPDAREKDGELFCLQCHDRMGIPICAACRRPIEERVVHALGKTWHVDHFVCAHCETPFLGSRHYEKKGAAYCELHYQQFFGRLCYVCNQVISGEIVDALGKCWCIQHFSCTFCDKLMDPNSKFYEIDQRPVCKPCYELLPMELRKRIAKMHKMED